ncbi:hypothetical protein ACFLUS_01840 [Chloroflexota bacterium]
MGAGTLYKNSPPQWLSAVLHLTYAADGFRAIMIDSRTLIEVIIERTVLVGFVFVISITATIALRRGTTG